MNTHTQVQRLGPIDTNLVTAKRRAVNVPVFDLAQKPTTSLVAHLSKSYMKH